MKVVGYILPGWILLVITGFGFLLRYSNQSGPQETVPVSWPVEAGLAADTARPTMVVLLHPRCACSHATLAELQRLLLDASTDVDLHVCFYCPHGEPDAWTETDLRERAERLEGASLHVDRGGQMAASFSATTSGTVVLYDRKGHCLFHGGVTSARAHEGNNVGRRTLTQLLREERFEPAENPVFGCPLGECRTGGDS